MNKLGIPEFAIKKRKAKLKSITPSERKQKALKYMADHPKLSVYMVAEHLGISKSMIYKYLKERLDERSIQR